MGVAGDEGNGGGGNLGKKRMKNNPEKFFRTEEVNL